MSDAKAAGRLVCLTERVLATVIAEADARNTPEVQHVRKFERVGAAMIQRED